MRRHLALALALLLPALAADAVEKAFDYRIEVDAARSVRLANRYAEDLSGSGRMECSVTCYDVVACAWIAFPVWMQVPDPPEVTFEDVDDLTMKYQQDTDWTNDSFMQSCIRGWHPNGTVIRFNGKDYPINRPTIVYTLRGNKWVDGDGKFTITVHDVVMPHPEDVDRTFSDVKTGSATLDSATLLAAPFPLQRVDSLPAVEERLRGGVPFCQPPPPDDTYNMANEPECLEPGELDASKVSWPDPQIFAAGSQDGEPTVVGAMLNAALTGDACDLTSASGMGANFCASMNDIGITIPPIAFVEARAEGKPKDDDAVAARYHEDACFFPTTLSFAPGGAQERWAVLDGADHWRSDVTPAHDPARNAECTAELPLGTNRVTFTAADAFGSTDATRTVRVSRGPVGLLHGYLFGGPQDFDDLGALLAENGFDQARIDLREKARFDGMLTFPFSYKQGIDHETKKPFKIGATRVAPRIDAPPFLKVKWPLPGFVLKIGELLGMFGVDTINVPLPAEFTSKQLHEKDFDLSAGITGTFKIDFKKEKAFIIVPNVFFVIDIHDGAPVVGPTRIEVPLHLKWNDFELAAMGVNASIKYNTRSDGDVVVQPYVRLKSPLFGLFLANGDLAKYQQSVKAFVDATLERTGYRRMALVGHDMGAVLARAQVQAQEVLKDRVDVVVMTGGPHRGNDTIFGVVKAAQLLAKALAKWLGPVGEVIKWLVDNLLDLVVGPGGKMLYPHSDYLQALNRDHSHSGTFDEPGLPFPLPPAWRVRIHNVVGRDWMGDDFGPTLCHKHIFGFGLPGFLNNLVKDPFYDMPNADGFVVPWICNGDGIVQGHSAEIGQPGVTDAVWYGEDGGHFSMLDEDLRLLELVCPLDPTVPGCETAAAAAPAPRAALAAGPATRPVPTAATSATGTDDPAAFAYETTTEEVALLPGHPAVVRVRTDRTATSAAFTVEGSAAIDVTVDVPHGGTLSATTAPGNGMYVAGLWDAAPGAGEYVVTLSLPPTALDPAEARVSAHVATQTVLALRVAGRTKTASGRDRIPGEDLFVSAGFVQGLLPPAGGVVDCLIHDPATGSERAFPLKDDGKHVDLDAGDGLFGAWIPGAWLAKEGSYRVSCRAVGAFQGEVVERHAALDLDVRWPTDYGISPGSLTVLGTPAAGEPIDVAFNAFNRGARPVDILKLEASERLDATGEERPIGCRVFAPLAPASNERVTLGWTPAEPGCREITVALSAMNSIAEQSNAPDTADPLADNVQRVHVCAADVPHPLVAAPGGPYRYQAGGRRVVLDGTGSANTTPASAFAWTVKSPDGQLLAQAAGRVAVVDVPRVPTATVTLRIDDPARGTATATTSLSDASASGDPAHPNPPFQDREPPVAVLVAPPTAIVGHPVVLRSESTDNFGTPPVQIFRVSGREPNAADGFGRSATVTFDQPGTYEVELFVQDNAGLRARATRAIHVERARPEITEVALPPALESGNDAEAFVVLSGLDRPAGELVQLRLASDAPGAPLVAGNLAETDACGVARVPFLSNSAAGETLNVSVEVLGYSTCDAATGACEGAVVSTNPNGAVSTVDHTPPTFAIASPAAGESEFDACRPLELRFSVFDQGSNVDPSSIRVLLDGTPLPITGDCLAGTCTVSASELPLEPGAHALVFLAVDAWGNRAEVRRDFTVFPSLDTLVCRIHSPLCAAIAPDGTETALLQQIDAARHGEATGDLNLAANVLDAFTSFAAAQRDQHIPAACSDALVADATWISRVRWAQ